LSVQGFDPKWRDFPDYIIGITRHIWEGRAIGSLNHYYAADIPVRTPMGIQRGNQAVIASTMATVHEFPDRELYGEDVIWSGDPQTGLLSSHRLLTTGTHKRAGTFGEPTGKRFTVRCIADCAAKDDVIFDEWLVRDYGGIVRQLGRHPRDVAQELIDAEGGVENCLRPFTPENDVAGEYTGRGNDNTWGEHYAETLTQLMNSDFDAVGRRYDRAVVTNYAGARDGVSWESVDAFWLGLRSSFPDATFQIHHQIGMDAQMLAPRAALRWSLDGIHSGVGSFGRPTGARVHVMGLSHAEYGPFVSAEQDGPGTIRRECALYDEVAIWKQILMQTSSS